MSSILINGSIMEQEKIQEFPKEIPQETPSLKGVIKSLLIIVLAVGIAYVVTVTIGMDNLRTKVESAGVFAPIILIILKATTIVVAPLGGTIIYPIAGGLFGFWKGLALTLLGDTIGSAIAFWISRRFGRSILHYFTGNGQMPMVERIIERLGDRKKFLKTRIFFSGFMDIFAYAAGLTKINFWYFIVVHIGVHAVLVALYILFGDLLATGKFGAFLIAGVGTTLLAGIGVWLFHLDLARGN